MNIKYFFLIVIFSIASLLHTSQTHIIAIPGILGSENNGHSDTILTCFSYNASVCKLSTLPISVYPWNNPDFGQYQCLNHLKNNLTQKNKTIENGVLVATSQGTATATRYLSELAYNNGPMPKVFICEGYAASFNACFDHSAQFFAPITRYVPLRYYLLPYIMKAASWYYNPSLEQPLELLEKLPKDLITIIVHCKKDRLTPYEGAQAAYQKLKTTGHEQTYLLSVDMDNYELDPHNYDKGHINVLENKTEYNNLKCLIQDLLNNRTHLNYIQFQPDTTEKGFINALANYEYKEKCTKILWYINTKVIPLFLVSYMCYKFFK